VTSWDQPASRMLAASLSVGLRVGLCRAESIRLKVRDVLMTRGCEALWIIRKRGARHMIAVHPETAQRQLAYLEAPEYADN
jgi:hypothetical protein